MFTKAKQVIDDITGSLADTAAEYSDPLQVMRLRKRLAKSEKECHEQQRLALLYLREVTILNRAVHKKRISIRGLRAKIGRMMKAGFLDPEYEAKLIELQKAGMIPGKPNGQEIESPMHRVFSKKEGA